MTKLTMALTVAFVFFFCTASLTAKALDVKLEEVANKLTAPLLLVEAPDNTHRKFIIEQVGLIKVLMPDGKLLDDPFLDISKKLTDLNPVFDEEGLLGLAFHPDFGSNGKFYVTYTGPIRKDASLPVKLWWENTETLAEFSVSKDNPNKADPASERVIMHVDQPQFNHNGGWISFGPDGYLYFSLGDGGYKNDWGPGHDPSLGSGQDTGTRLGTILRIDVNTPDTENELPYSVPKDNPFVGEDGFLPEIWAYGFRNPWRCSFDMGGNNDLICGDVGQNAYEEINVVTKGGNYGWRQKEGMHCFDYLNPNEHPTSCNDKGMIDPVIEYKSCNVFDNCKGLSITGGYVYRGEHSAWKGKYFFADWSKQFGKGDGVLYVASKKGDKWSMEEINVTNLPNFSAFILSFGQDRQGDVYVMVSDTLGPVKASDKIYKLVPAD